jgi:hypothetical protein
MLNRRNFTFSSLALALAPLAHGADISGTLRPRWTRSVQAGILEVRLKVVNTGQTPVSVLMIGYEGSRLGADVRAKPIGASTGVAAEPIRSEEQRRTFMLRVGPPTSFEAVPPGRELELGLFHFQLPDNTKALAGLDVKASVQTNAGDVEFTLLIPARDLQPAT